LVLAEQTFDQFAVVKLVEPFEANLRKKKESMKVATQQFNKLLDYEVGEVTAAATFYLAEIYANFSKDLKESERPAGLNALEREEYELAIEEQAYPFEEKAIATHKSNLELISLGVYNVWIDKSLEKLALFLPARYAKPEEESAVIVSLDSYLFAMERPKAPEEAAAQTGEVQQDAKPAEATEAAPVAEANQEAEPAEAEAKEAAPVAEPKQAAEQTETKEAAKAEERAPGADDSGDQGAPPDAVVE
jgi:hypothetical protein